MSILKKPYEISVWQDIWQGDKFCEQRLGIIGTNEMLYQGRAIEPNLVRNVNGTKKFSFKMYKHFIDTATGEKVDNPFVEWLISERKVKLKYEKDENGNDIWHDFIIKDVVENSSNYLYTYQLEDALVQELSKNGFGVTLDAQLMNNMGTAGELGAKVLEETDWTVQSEVFVQKVEEALVYVQVDTSFPATKILDQTGLDAGISTEQTIITASTTILAFYSSCTEQPYRFQFIKLDDYANVSTDENRVINVANCQYYYDVFAAGKTYTKTNEGFYLPTGWMVLDKGPDAIDNKNDTTVSNWYRGARYGFAQDAEYVPLLDRYCQKFWTKGKSPVVMSDWTTFNSSDLIIKGQSITIPITGHAGGLRLDADKLEVGNVYKLNISFSATGNTPMTHIGAHLPPERFKQLGLYINGRKIAAHIGEGFEIEDPTNNNSLELTFQVLGEAASQDFLCIQPNRGHYPIEEYNGDMSFQVTINSFEKIEYAFIDNTYTSPALVQNVISSPNGEKTSGWTVAAIASDVDKPQIESVYGRFEDSNFISVIDDLQGAGTTGKTYKSYLKVKFTDANQRLINSGFYDNRTLIGSVTTGEKWVLKSELVGSPALNYQLNEVKYNTTTDCHDINTAWTNLVSLSDSTEGVMIFSRGTGVSEKEFKKKKIKLVISPNGTPSAEAPVEFYIENLELYQAIENGKDENDQPIYMSPGELDQSGIITTTYNFFSPAALETVETAEELAYEKVDKSELYTKYTPVFNENAEKIRSITAKESNYFNILQSIAETFECWLSLEVGRSTDGAITSKVAKFKNYAGNDNYAAFRYGVNLKDIQRTFTSKNIVTKLMVKANSNEHAQNGFCTIQRAGANPTGESYLYDFQYYHNKGLLRAEDFIHVYYIDGATGPDLGENHSAESYNLNGYYPRLKTLNNLLLPINQSIIDLNADLTTLRAEEAVEEGLYYAAKEGIEEVREDFKTLTYLDIDKTSPAQYTIECTVPNANSLNSGKDWAQDATINSSSDTNKKVWTFTITLTNEEGASADDEFYFQPTFVVKEEGVELTRKSPKLMAKFDTAGNSTTYEYELKLVEDGSKARDLQKQFEVYTVQLQNSLVKLGKEPDSTDTEAPEPNTIKSAIAAKEAALIAKEAERDKYLTYKKALNRLFFEKYARFIQEGTWISEEYVDDDKYYIDAQSVLYNSCYPQVAYTINVLALSRLPGYELFEFGLGDKTYTEDPEFFEAEGGRVKVIISEKSENLDDPTKDVIRVQNFKNQFQDLFQKITATVQQTQYSTGAYKKAVALAEADVAKKGEFLSEALSDANAKLSAAGQTTVKQDIDGITLTDSKTNDKMRLIGGAILMGVLDENGERQWRTGLTPEGISASLVTAGTINTGSIAIMDGNNPAFRWDAFGISAFNADWDANGIQGTPDKTKFVRFDKHGIYGIDGGVDGTSWKPGISDSYSGKAVDEIDARSTFALTWQGLKVTGNNNTVARIGKIDNNIINITKDGQSIFRVGNDGSSEIAGWTISSKTGYAGGFYHDVMTDSGKNPTHRFGLKIENGTNERYAFYVKKFKEDQTLWDKPTGDLVFGVRYNGEVIATKGKIGGWDVNKEFISKEVNGLVSGMCSISLPESQGLDFQPKIMDDSSYTVKDIGTCTDTNIIIPSAYKGKPVTSILAAAFVTNCSNRVSIVIPNSVTVISQYAFAGCSSLESITLPFIGLQKDGENNTHFGIIFGARNYFDNSTSVPSSLKNVIITGGSSIDAFAFYGCSSLVNVTIANSITSIGNNAFYNCTGLTSITIPDSVTSIGDFAFYGCSNLKKVILPASVKTIGNNAFWNVNEDLTIYCELADIPENWKNNGSNPWTSSATVVYNYVTNYAHKSLVNENMTSAPRFFAGTNGSKGPCTISSNPNFLVLEDGSLYANAVDIKGNINADKGYIGDLDIVDGGLTYFNSNSNPIYSLNQSGLTILPSDASIKVGNVSLQYNTTESATILETSDALKIRGQNNTGLNFMASSSKSKIDTDLTLYVVRITDTEFLDELRTYVAYEGNNCYYTSNYIEIEYELGLNNQTVTKQALGYRIQKNSKKSNCSNITLFGSQEIRFKISGEWTDWFLSDNFDDTEKSFEGAGHIYQEERNNYIEVTGHLVPTENSELKEDGVTTTGFDLGKEGKAWNNIWARNDKIQVSDRKEKDNIEVLSECYRNIFDKLKPVSYKFKVNSSDRTHTGLIAQDVKDAVESSGLTTQEFAGYCEWTNDDGSTGCGLRYGEFISLCIDQIQKLKPRVSALEQTILSWENRISNLESKFKT